VTVVIVDESGVLKELCRMDGAPLVSVQTAMSRAYAAAAIAMPPDEFYTAIEADYARSSESTSRQPGAVRITLICISPEVPAEPASLRGIS
jgi:uncharacterized protein GlcG (DUF336 family)